MTRNVSPCDAVRMTDSKKMGRPVLPEGKARSAVVRFRVTESERARMEAAAEKAGVSLSEWARVRLVRAARRCSPGRLRS